MLVSNGLNFFSAVPASFGGRTLFGLRTSMEDNFTVEKIKWKPHYQSFVVYSFLLDLFFLVLIGQSLYQYTLNQRQKDKKK